MADPVIGQLFVSPTRAYPLAKQPGGPGTVVVDPTQPPQYLINRYAQVPPQENAAPFAESATRFHPGCGHHIMSYEIERCSVGGSTSELLVCPLCGYIQAIYPFGQLDKEFAQGYGLVFA